MEGEESLRRRGCCVEGEVVIVVIIWGMVQRDPRGGFFGMEAEGAEGGIPIASLDGFVESRGGAGRGGHCVG
jgi:hypothetical protein